MRAEEMRAEARRHVHDACTPRPPDERRRGDRRRGGDCPRVPELTRG